MSKIKYREEDIDLQENTKFEEGQMTVSKPSGGMVYRAITRFGTAYSGAPQKALDDAKHQIDKNLDKK